jgi:hypothetical protein
VQLTASTDFDADGLWVFFINISTGIDCVFDIGLGAAGSERILIPDIMFRGEETDGPNIGFSARFFPVSIPAGTRLAVRSATPDAGGEIRVSVLLQKGGLLAPQPYQRVATYGVPGTLAVPYATLVDPGASANTKGSWVQFVSSTPFDVKGIVLSLGSATGILTTARWSWDIGIGASGSEVVRVPDLGAALQSTTEQYEYAGGLFIPIDIPAGVRVAIRCACNITDSGDRPAYAVLHLVG